MAACSRGRGLASLAWMVGSSPDGCAGAEAERGGGVCVAGFTSCLAQPSLGARAGGVAGGGTASAGRRGGGGPWSMLSAVGRWCSCSVPLPTAGERHGDELPWWLLVAAFRFAPDRQDTDREPHHHRLSLFDSVTGALAADLRHIVN